MLTSRKILPSRLFFNFGNGMNVMSLFLTRTHFRLKGCNLSRLYLKTYLKTYENCIVAVLILLFSHRFYFEYDSNLFPSFITSFTFFILFAISQLPSFNFMSNAFYFSESIRAYIISYVVSF